MDRVILDSNVILKHIFGEMDASPIWQVATVHYNPVIHSEVLYVLLLNETEKRPYDLKKNPDLVRSAAQHVLREMEIFDTMVFLPVNTITLKMAEVLVERYGLLPGDATILATAIKTGMNYIITEDRDLLRLRKVENCKIIDAGTYLSRIDR